MKHAMNCRLLRVFNGAFGRAGRRGVDSQTVPHSVSLQHEGREGGRLESSAKRAERDRAARRTKKSR